MSPLFLIGQRVIVGGYIGKVTNPPLGREMSKTKPERNDEAYTWVELSGNTFSSYYDNKNVKPLPGGQL